MISKSWGLTILLYSLSIGLVFLESFTGIVVTDAQFNFMLGIVGISTAGGTSNAILSNRQQIKDLIENLKKSS